MSRQHHDPAKAAQDRTLGASLAAVDPCLDPRGIQLIDELHERHGRVATGTIWGAVLATSRVVMAMRKHMHHHLPRCRHLRHFSCLS